MKVKYLTDANHYKNDNSHPQYSNIYGKYKSPRYSGDNAPYYKFLTVNVGIQANAIVEFVLNSGEGSGNGAGSNFNVFFRANKSTPSQGIFVVENLTGTNTNEIIVTKKGNVYNFYFKFTNTYDRFYISPTLLSGDVVFDEFGKFYNVIPSDEISVKSNHSALFVNTVDTMPVAANGLIVKQKSVDEDRDIIKIAMDYKNSISFREILTKDHVCIRSDSSLPSASAYYLGHFKMSRVSGNDSKLFICIQLADNSYAWKEINLK